MLNNEVFEESLLAEDIDFKSFHTSSKTFSNGVRLVNVGIWFRLVNLGHLRTNRCWFRKRLDIRMIVGAF